MSQNYHIAADSCTDVTKEMRQDSGLKLVPLTLRVGNQQMLDDESFNQHAFLDAVDQNEEVPHSACPSPGAFCEAYGEDNVDAYGITLSSKMSGSYNSALLGAKILQEDFPEKRIHVFDSKSAACGQTLILMKLKECLNAGFSFDKTVAAVEKYIKEQSTVFVLETIDMLRKNGRLSNLEGTLLTALNIKPILGSTPEGEVKKVGIGRGMKQSLKKLMDYIGETVIDPANKYLAITHCNCLARAEWLKEEIMKRYPFKDVLIFDAAGVSSLYAGRGGIVVAY